MQAPDDTPIALIVFNRPALTARVFEFIRSARPATLFVIADGPRPDRPGEEQRCAETRRVTERIDWPCVVHRDYAPRNLGCRRRVTTGLDLVFSKVESAIVLEDDCLPDPSFVPFAARMLDRYADDRRVMAVCGTNILGSWEPHRYSYFFSRFGCVWGWATWRRAWELNDRDMVLWRDAWVRTTVQAICGPDFRVKEAGYDGAYAGEIDTWDYQWELTRIAHGGLSVVPSRNLISNIGFGADATHTRDPDSEFSSMPGHAMEFPLRSPPTFLPDVMFDAQCLRREGGPYLQRLLSAPATRRVRKLVRKVIGRR
jgi:hypothetical protein